MQPSDRELSNIYIYIGLFVANDVDFVLLFTSSFAKTLSFSFRSFCFRQKVAKMTTTMAMMRNKNTKSGMTAFGSLTINVRGT